jgi:hypothetical protein
MSYCLQRKDTTIVANRKKVEDFKTYNDAFNYLGSLGWRFATGPFVVLHFYRTTRSVFCFKREFDAVELNEGGCQSIVENCIHGGGGWWVIINKGSRRR